MAKAWWFWAMVVLIPAATISAHAAEIVRPGIHVACKSFDNLARLQALDRRGRSGLHDRLLHGKPLNGQCVQLPPGDEVRVLNEDWRRGLLRVYRVGDSGVWWVRMLSIWKEEEVAVRAHARHGR